MLYVQCLLGLCFLVGLKQFLPGAEAREVDVHFGPELHENTVESQTALDSDSRAARKLDFPLEEEVFVRSIRHSRETPDQREILAHRSQYRDPREEAASKNQVDNRFGPEIHGSFYQQKDSDKFENELDSDRRHTRKSDLPLEEEVVLRSIRHSREPLDSNHQREVLSRRSQYKDPREETTSNKKVDIRFGPENLSSSYQRTDADYSEDELESDRQHSRTSDMPLEEEVMLRSIRHSHELPEDSLSSRQRVLLSRHALYNDLRDKIRRKRRCSLDIEEEDEELERERLIRKALRKRASPCSRNSRAHRSQLDSYDSLPLEQSCSRDSRIRRSSLDSYDSAHEQSCSKDSRTLSCPLGFPDSLPLEQEVTIRKPSPQRSLDKQLRDREERMKEEVLKKNIEEEAEEKALLRQFLREKSLSTCGGARSPRSLLELCGGPQLDKEEEREVTIRTSRKPSSSKRSASRAEQAEDPEEDEEDEEEEVVTKKTVKEVKPEKQEQKGRSVSPKNSKSQRVEEEEVVSKKVVRDVSEPRSKSATSSKQQQKNRSISPKKGKSQSQGKGKSSAPKKQQKGKKGGKNSKSKQ